MNYNGFGFSPSLLTRKSQENNCTRCIFFDVGPKRKKNQKFSSLSSTLICQARIFRNWHLRYTLYIDKSRKSNKSHVAYHCLQMLRPISAVIMELT